MPRSAANEDRVVSAQSQRGLDWFAFFLADIQTGWGPFVTAYLTSRNWSQLDIGLILSAGTFASMAMQIPIGALIDYIPAKRTLAAIAVLAISASALLLVLWPTFHIVLLAKLLHAIASCLAGPIVAALSLGLVGYSLLSVRLGRNARFLSLGNGIAAGLMGGLGYYYSNEAIFYLTAALAVPALIALARIRSSDINADLARGGTRRKTTGIKWAHGFLFVLRNRLLLIFASAIMLFQLANAAMLPIMAGSLTIRSPQWATAVIAVCILGPQFVVALIAPWVGTIIPIWGRRPLLIGCFAAVCMRGVIFAVSTNPAVIIPAQLLDGISAASLGVLVPLIIADATRGSGHYNFAQGLIGVAVGIGASISTTLAGYVADTAGDAATFAMLASFAAGGVLLILLAMPESRVSLRGQSVATREPTQDIP